MSWLELEKVESPLPSRRKIPQATPAEDDKEHQAEGEEWTLAQCSG
ncbi:hypothetical protein [Reticulibacter mediterranei]|nr:hypothetical protein [Reticulibacter mediterranei]